MIQGENHASTLIFVRRGRDAADFRAGFINAAGAIVVDPTYDNASIFKNGRASVKLKGKWGAVDEFGNMLIAPISSNQLQFSEGRAEFSSDGKYRLLDDKGNVVILPKYENIGEFKGGLAWVESKHLYGFVEPVDTSRFPFFSKMPDRFPKGCVQLS